MMLNLTLNVRNALGNATTIDTSAWSEGFVKYMLEYAHDVRMQRCTASVDKDDPDKKAKKIEARTAMFESMVAGEMPTRGGGGGPRLSARDQAERDVLTTQLQAICGLTKTAAEKQAKHADDAWSAITRHVVIANLGKGKSPDEIAEGIDKWIEKALPAIKAKFEPEILARMPKETTITLNMDDILG